jgi:hypothetical protein
VSLLVGAFVFGLTMHGSSAGAASCDSSVSSDSSADALKPFSGVSELCGLCLLTLNPLFIFRVSVVTAGSSSFAFVSYRNSAGALISVHKQRLCHMLNTFGKTLSADKTTRIIEAAKRKAQSVVSCCTCVLYSLHPMFAV